MKVQIGIIGDENIIGEFESEFVPNVGEVIFDQKTRRHYKVVDRIFGIYKGYSHCPMDVTLWCKEYKYERKYRV